MTFRVFTKSEEEIVCTAYDASKLWHRGFLSGSAPRLVELESGTEYVIEFGDLVPLPALRNETPVSLDEPAALAASA